MISHILTCAHQHQGLKIVNRLQTKQNKKKAELKDRLNRCSQDGRWCFSWDFVISCLPFILRRLK